MRLATLFSGGKDSTFATYLMEQQGHAVAKLVSILPMDRDSWLFHTPNLHLLPLMAEAMGKELIAVESSGSEVDDLEALRSSLSGLDVEGVITGAIASDYQWDRINGVCQDLGLKVFSPMWRKDQSMLLREMVNAGVKAVMVNVSAEGLGPSWLGREIDGKAIEELETLQRRFGINVSGEGGEYETLVIDSPIHRKAINILVRELEERRDGGRMNVKKAILR